MSKGSKVEIITPVNIVGFILVMMAGWIDMAGLKIFLNERVSFMTGRAAQLGEWIAEGAFGQLKIVVIIIITFILGASISTRVTRRLGLLGGLTLEGTLLIMSAFFMYKDNSKLAAIIIPMAMGVQNAATSLTPINRTTHLTGPATDIGMNLASGNWNQVMFWLLHWVAFPLGAFIGYNFIVRAKLDRNIDMSLVIIIPAIIIILTGIIQKVTVNIPLLMNQDSFKNK